MIVSNRKNLEFSLEIHEALPQRDFGKDTASNRTMVVTNEILGTNNSDDLTGTDGNDLIRGLNGRDTIIGGAGDDTLVGGLGGDLLTGGGGSDSFVFDSISERTDSITDFSVIDDLLDLTNLFAEIEYGGSDPIAEGYLQFMQDDSSTKVRVDEDGLDGSAPFRTIAVLDSVTATDLVIGSNVII